MNKQVIIETCHEALGLQKYLTEEQKQKLQQRRRKLHAYSHYRCVYGLIFGYAKLTRAVDLQKKVGKPCHFDVLENYIEFEQEEFSVNEKPHLFAQKFVLNPHIIFVLTNLEYFLLSNERQNRAFINQSVIDLILGETTPVTFYKHCIKYVLRSN